MVWHERPGSFWTVRFVEEESAGGGWHDEESYEDTVELWVALPRDEHDALEALAEHLNLSASDAVRKAVTLMSLLVEKRDSGHRVLLQDESRELYAVDF